MKRIGIGAAVVVLLLVGAYLFAPYYTLWRLVQAARAHDIKTVTALVDFPSVRATLKPQLTAALQAQLTADQPKPKNLLEQIGAALSPVLVGNAVDSVVTPDGVATMLRTARAPHPVASFGKAPPPPDDETGLGDPKLVDMGYNGVLWDLARRKVLDLDFDQFHATVTSRSHPEAKINLFLLRRGVFDWRVEALDIPALSQPK